MDKEYFTFAVEQVSFRSYETEEHLNFEMLVLFDHDASEMLELLDDYDNFLPLIVPVGVRYKPGTTEFGRVVVEFSGVCERYGPDYLEDNEYMLEVLKEALEEILQENYQNLGQFHRNDLGNKLFFESAEAFMIKRNRLFISGREVS